MSELPFTIATKRLRIPHNNNGKQKNAGVAILVYDQKDFKTTNQKKKIKKKKKS